MPRILVTRRPLISHRAKNMKYPCLAMLFEINPNETENRFVAMMDWMEKVRRGQRFQQWSRASRSCLGTANFDRQQRSDAGWLMTT